MCVCGARGRTRFSGGNSEHHASDQPYKDEHAAGGIGRVDEGKDQKIGIHADIGDAEAAGHLVLALAVAQGDEQEREQENAVDEEHGDAHFEQIRPERAVGDDGVALPHQRADQPVLADRLDGEVDHVEVSGIAARRPVGVLSQQALDDDGIAEQGKDDEKREEQEDDGDDDGFDRAAVRAAVEDEFQDKDGGHSDDRSTREGEIVGERDDGELDPEQEGTVFFGDEFRPDEGEQDDGKAAEDDGVAHESRDADDVAAVQREDVLAVEDEEAVGKDVAEDVLHDRKGADEHTAVDEYAVKAADALAIEPQGRDQEEPRIDVVVAEPDGGVIQGRLSRDHLEKADGKAEDDPCEVETQHFCIAAALHHSREAGIELPDEQDGKAGVHQQSPVADEIVDESAERNENDDNADKQIGHIDGALLVAADIRPACHSRLHLRFSLRNDGSQRRRKPRIAVFFCDFLPIGLYTGIGT